MFNLPEKELEVLKFWQENKIFEKTLEKDSPKGDYVFYDGPPFATGTPHYGHVVASLMKDIIPRYFTMKGFRVERKWGWDTHGLPIENIVEEELKTKSKKDIEDYGVDKFNELCRGKVLTYADEWRKVVDRMGRWADMDNAYKTMDKDYMESIWWVFKQLWDKDLIYKDYKSMHICPRCETTLSQSEVTEGYEDVKDISVTTKFELEDGSFVLAWTTTPWTLPGNVALAVGEDIDYIKIKLDNEVYILAKETSEKVLDGKDYEVTGEIKGKELVGKSYKPLFGYYLNKDLDNKKNLYTIHSADFVTTEDGTGVVHIAPAFGEDDMGLGREKELPFIQHVGPDGRFTEDVTDFAGTEVKPKDDPSSTDKKVIEFLKDKNLLFSSEEYEHSYPHCWRCHSPLLNYATDSWFVKVTDIKDNALKTAKEINWVPSHIKEGRFGKWLEGARDWSISRQRFWGSVMPIWECECGQKKVIGSIEELEKLSGETVTDLHKHYIDKITFPCDKCESQMKRIPDVLDCWFESGSMPYAQMHYPFENKDKFEDNFPAEFIAEGADQTRAWFYYMHILGTAIKKSHAYKNVIVNGIVLAEDGKKMSKHLNNYPDPMDLMNKHGADPMRYYLCSSPVMKADDLRFSEKDMIEQTRFFNTLFNVVSFYKMFEQSDTNEKLKTDNILDKWMIARLEQSKKIITDKLDRYDLHAIREMPMLIDDLSTWFVRRSRDRIKGSDEKDKKQALYTLRHVIFNLNRIMAPFMPFISDILNKQMGGREESVHLSTWPKVEDKLIDQKVLDYMDITRKVVEMGLASRAEHGIKVRQPLYSFTVFNQNIPEEYLDLIKDEVNVKEVLFDKKDDEQISVELNTEISQELKVEGYLRELVRTINNIRKKQGLTIGDKAIVKIKSSDEIVRSVMDKFSNDLKRQVLAESIEFTKDSLEEYKVNELQVGLKVDKI